jgi:uncharacterized protein with HEPN domain
MRRDPAKPLHDMLDSCTFLMQFTVGRSQGDLRNDRGFRSAVERELIIIGEALAALERIAPDKAAQISEHKRIIRYRHVLVHGYDVVDPDITWAILTEKLPILKVELDGLFSG